MVIRLGMVGPLLQVTRTVGGEVIGLLLPSHTPTTLTDHDHRSAIKRRSDYESTLTILC
jgi:hypothetical protein